MSCEAVVTISLRVELVLVLHFETDLVYVAATGNPS